MPKLTASRTQRFSRRRKGENQLASHRETPVVLSRAPVRLHPDWEQARMVVGPPVEPGVRLFGDALAKAQGRVERGSPFCVH